MSLQRQKRRSEKTEIARPKKRKRRKRGKAGERTSGSARIKRSPLPPRHETYTRSPRTLFLIFHFRLLIKNVNFGRAWAGYGCRKCFDFSCQMQNSSQQILSHLLNSSASSFATLSPLLSSNVSSYVVNDSSAFEARRAANFLFNQKCLVIDLVHRNVTFWAVCV